MQKEVDDEQERRAGGDTARRWRYSKVKGSGGGGGRTSTPTPERGADSSEDESVTIPGLTGVLVTQLTWGRGNGAWDATLQDGAGDGAAAAVAGTDTPGSREGLVGTTTLREISVSTRKSGAEAARTGGVGLEEGASGRDAHGRRLTYTEVSSFCFTTAAGCLCTDVAPGASGSSCSANSFRNTYSRMSNSFGTDNRLLSA